MEEKEGEDEDLYAPLGVNGEYDTILNSAKAKAVVIANRPPAPTPRPEGTQLVDSKTPYITQGNLRLFSCTTHSDSYNSDDSGSELCRMGGGRAWNVHRHHQQSAAERKEGLLCHAVCFDIRNRKNIVAPRHKTNTSESGERLICLRWEPAVPNCSITAVWIFHEDETSKSDWYYQGL